MLTTTDTVGVNFLKWKKIESNELVFQDVTGQLKREFIHHNQVDM